MQNPCLTSITHVRKVQNTVTILTFSQAQLALETDETPVACVFVHEGKVIARGMNATNRTMNGTRHAEFQAIASILSPTPLPDVRTPNIIPPVDPSRPKYTADILKQCDLYVTVEPCIMCASLLRQFGIRKVYFGAANDRFGGTGGVMNIHSCPAVDSSYEVSGGWLREEAIMMLRRFYVQENGKGELPYFCYFDVEDGKREHGMGRMEKERERHKMRRKLMCYNSTGAETEEGESTERRLRRRRKGG